MRASSITATVLSILTFCIATSAQTDTLRLEVPVFASKTNVKTNAVTYSPLKTTAPFEVEIRLFDGPPSFETPPAEIFDETFSVIPKGTSAPFDLAAGLVGAPDKVLGTVSLVLGAQTGHELPNDLFVQDVWFSSRVTTFKKNGSVAHEYTESPLQPLGLRGITEGQELRPRALVAADSVVTPSLQLTTGAGDALVLVSDAAGIATWQAIASSSITDESILSDDIGVAAVGNSELAGDAVTSDKIADASIVGDDIAEDTITSTNIAGAAVGPSELAFDSVTTSHIQDGAVTSADIANGTITGTDVADDTLTGLDILDNSITSAEIADGAVTGADIASNTITAADIAPAAVGAAELAANAVSSSTIVDGSILGLDIANGTITGTDIAFGTITSSNIADSTITGSDIAFDTITTSDIATNGVGNSELTDFVDVQNLNLVNSASSRRIQLWTSGSGVVDTYNTAGTVQAIQLWGGNTSDTLGGLLSLSNNSGTIVVQLQPDGDIFNTGSGFAAAPDPQDPTRQIQFGTLTGPEVGTYVRGHSRLVGGQALIELPDAFGFVTSANGLTVQVTPRGPCHGLYVEQLDLDTLVVRELDGWRSDVPFDWMVQGQRKGFEDEPVFAPNTNFLPRALDADTFEIFRRHLPALVSNGILRADGSVNEELVALLIARTALPEPLAEQE